MSRGKSLKEADDFNREPYSSVIELLYSIDNYPLSFDELRFILLVEHGLATLKNDKIKRSEFENKLITYKKESIMFMDLRWREEKILNTTGENKGKPMDVNGLNQLLKRMRNPKYKVLQLIDSKYSLSEGFLKRFNYQFTSKKISSCSSDEMCIIGEQLFCFNLNLRKLGVDKEKETNDQDVKKINDILSQLSDVIMHLWIRNKLKEFYEKLHTIKDEENRKLRKKQNEKKDGGLTTEFYAYCIEMANWLIKSSNKKIEHFKHQIKKIKDLPGEVSLEMSTYLINITRTKKKLKEKTVRVSVRDLSGSKHEKIIERPLLDVISIISWNENIPVTEAIQKLVHDKQLSEEDGNLLIMEQEFSKLYRELELDKIISSKVLDRTPVIVYDVY